MTFSMTLRTALLRLPAFSSVLTTGRLPTVPWTRVLLSSLWLILRSPFLNCTALARSIRCGKSSAHSCGGTYGHLVW